MGLSPDLLLQQQKQQTAVKDLADIFCFGTQLESVFYTKETTHIWQLYSFLTAMYELSLVVDTLLTTSWHAAT
jgi:hypothetical protein